MFVHRKHKNMALKEFECILRMDVIDAPLQITL